MNALLFAFFFFLPAAFANMAPVFAAKIPILKNWSYPLDGYKKWHNKRIFGDHKTIRGLVAGIVLAILVVLSEQYIYSAHHPTFITVNYELINPILLGFLLGFGALFGDAIKSFFKRQMNIKEGIAWFPWDQIDFIIGGCVISALYVRLNITQYLTIVVLYFVLHLLAKVVGYFFKLNSTAI